MGGAVAQLVRAHNGRGDEVDAADCAQLSIALAGVGIVLGLLCDQQR